MPARFLIDVNLPHDLACLRKVKVREQPMDGLAAMHAGLKPRRTASPPLIRKKAGMGEGQPLTPPSASRQSDADPHPSVFFRRVIGDTSLRLLWFSATIHEPRRLMKSFTQGEETCSGQRHGKRAHHSVRSREASWSAVACHRFRPPDARENFPDPATTSPAKRPLRSAPPPHSKTLLRSAYAFPFRARSRASHVFIPHPAFRVPHFPHAPR